MNIIIIILVCIFLTVFQAKIKGQIGEKIVAHKLKKLSQDGYTVFNDVLLNTEKGTSQIDHIVISEYGIFVIETKNYKGWIFGGENSNQWVKNMYGKKYKFLNPIKQNKGHVKALADLLEFSENSFIPIVVFMRRATLKVQVQSLVIYSSKLLPVMRRFTQKRFTQQELEVIQKKISDNNIKSRDARKNHVLQTRKKIRTRKIQEKLGICPRCGGNLVKRKGRYGWFYGCSNYPQCRYTSKGER